MDKINRPVIPVGITPNQSDAVDESDDAVDEMVDESVDE